MRCKTGTPETADTTALWGGEWGVGRGEVGAERSRRKHQDSFLSKKFFHLPTSCNIADPHTLQQLCPPLLRVLNPR